MGSEKWKQKVDMKRIPPEKIELDTLYTLTLNFDMEKVHKKKAISAFYNVYTEQRQILYDLFGKYTISITPEISTNGKLHWHGIILFKTFTKVGKFYSQLPIYLNLLQMELDTISDIKEWVEYCNKGSNYMRALLATYKLPYHNVDPNEVKPLAKPGVGCGEIMK